jgi:hypothetical protein
MLDRAAAAAAGAAHGQLASDVTAGIGVSGHKVVDEGARALLLIVPGIVRIDVRPLEDGLQVIPRVLGDMTLGWEVDPDAMTDYGRTAEETRIPALVAFRIAVWDEEQPLAGRVIVSYTRGAEHGPTHFSAHAILQQVSAER